MTAPATADRSEFRHILVSGASVGAVTAAAVVLFLLASRVLPAGIVSSLALMIIVLAGGVLAAFLPGFFAAARTVQGVASAAAIGLWGTIAFMAIDIILLRPFKAYPWTWDAIGGGGTGGRRGRLRSGVCGWERSLRCDSRVRSSCSPSPAPGHCCSASPCSGPGFVSCAACRICSRTTWRLAPPRSMPRLRPRIEFFLLIAGVSQLSAQGRGRDVRVGYGRWDSGNQSKSYELRTDAPIAGIFSHGLAIQVLIHDNLGRHHAFYGAGWQLHAFRRRAKFGPYALAGVSVGVSTDTSSQELAALWTLGGGVEWRAIPWAAFGLETVYRMQDVGPRGFWRTAANSRDGIAASIGFSMTIGRSVDRRWPTPGQERTAQPPRPPLMIIGDVTGSAAGIVKTALDALGTPYVWGGTAANGV